MGVRLSSTCRLHLLSLDTDMAATALDTDTATHLHTDLHTAHTEPDTAHTEPDTAHTEPDMAHGEPDTEDTEPDTATAHTAVDTGDTAHTEPDTDTHTQDTDPRTEPADTDMATAIRSSLGWFKRFKKHLVCEDRLMITQDLNSLSLKT